MSLCSIVKVDVSDRSPDELGDVLEGPRAEGALLAATGVSDHAVFTGRALPTSISHIRTRRSPKATSSSGTSGIAEIAMTVAQRRTVRTHWPGAYRAALEWADESGRVIA